MQGRQLLSRHTLSLHSLSRHNLSRHSLGRHTLSRAFDANLLQPEPGPAPEIIRRNPFGVSPREDVQIAAFPIRPSRLVDGDARARHDQRGSGGGRPPERRRGSLMAPRLPEERLPLDAGGDVPGRRTLCQRFRRRLEEIHLVATLPALAQVRAHLLPFWGRQFLEEVGAQERLTALAVEIPCRIVFPADPFFVGHGHLLRSPPPCAAHLIAFSGHGGSGSRCWRWSSR